MSPGYALELIRKGQRAQRKPFVILVKHEKLHSKAELRSKTSRQVFGREVRALNVLGLLDGTCGCCACSS